ncbi:hypothetical protein DFP72DRAFT_637331 [Ephemerocybe angulata]|uniref:Uncharacterized protein n=1 Tax=Ephemerocybe angulata TaxID=980116 RepID=A0A8H6LZF0_9AGAR|nr:hypothetical protein DFP72DRAFT_637331 [Tulosesus angulatus]
MHACKDGVQTRVTWYIQLLIPPRFLPHKAALSLDRLHSIFTCNNRRRNPSSEHTTSGIDTAAPNKSQVATPRSKPCTRRKGGDNLKDSTYLATSMVAKNAHSFSKGLLLPYQTFRMPICSRAKSSAWSHASLEAFFSSFPGFKYELEEPSIPAFRRLCRFLHLEPGDSAWEDLYSAFVAAAHASQSSIRELKPRRLSRSRSASLDEVGVGGPVYDFFAQFAYPYNGTDATIAFDRLWDGLWEVLQHYPYCWSLWIGLEDEFRAALRDQFAFVFGEDASDRRSWERLCRRLGINSVEMDLEDIQEVISCTHVNLVDILNRSIPDGRVPKFLTEEEKWAYNSSIEEEHRYRRSQSSATSWIHLRRSLC